MKLRTGFLIGCSIFVVQAHAGFGTNSIGIGAQARGFAGAGTALNLGYESIYSNPALMRAMGNYELSIGGSYQDSTTTAINEDAIFVSANSSTKTSESPYQLNSTMGFVKNFNQSLSFGAASYTVSNFGANYADTKLRNGLGGISSALKVQQVTPAVSFKYQDFSVGLAMPITYGSFSLGYYDGTRYVSAGQSQDTAVSFNLGAAYQRQSFAVGFTYKTQAELTYNNQLKEFAEDFNMEGIVSSDDLAVPGEYTLAFAYFLNKDLTLIADYKVIAWNEASGYQDLGWDEQTVMAFAVSYKINNTTIRFGYSTTESPLGSDAIKNSQRSTPNNGQSLNYLNLIAMPALITSHIGMGVGHKFSANFDIDASFVYGLENSAKARYNSGSANMDYESKRSETSLSIIGNFRY